MKSLNGVAVVAAWGAIAVASVAVNAVGQTTWTVCHDGTCDFASLQSAINTAADGDVIQISAGTFTEAPIAIHNRDLTLAGSTLAVTELSGSLTSRILSITGTSSVRLRDIRFIDGRAAGERGGAIAFYGLALDIDGCSFHNNHAGDGGAIFAEGAHLRVVASEFTNNAALGVSHPDGGAIKLAGTTATLVRCVFLNNTAGYSGGGVSQTAGSLWATSSVFDSNYAPLGGALEVYAHNFALTLVNCTLLNNVGQASSGSAVQAYYAQVRLVNTIVSGTGLLLRTLYGGGFKGAHSLLSHGELAGWGNQVGAPMLSDAYEPLPGSPCLDSGTDRLMLSEFDVVG